MENIPKDNNLLTHLKDKLSLMIEQQGDQISITGSEYRSYQPYLSHEFKDKGYRLFCFPNNRVVFPEKEFNLDQQAEQYYKSLTTNRNTSSLLPLIIIKEGVKKRNRGKPLEFQLN